MSMWQSTRQPALDRSGDGYLVFCLSALLPIFARKCVIKISRQIYVIQGYDSQNLRIKSLCVVFLYRCCINEAT